MAGGRHDYCQACRQTQEQAGKQRDCTSCEGRCPDIMPENLEAWQLWLVVNTQWRTGFGGAAGLDYVAVFAVAEVYGLEVTPALFRKIKALEMYELRGSEKK